MQRRNRIFRLLQGSMVLLILVIVALSVVAIATSREDVASVPPPVVAPTAVPTQEVAPTLPAEQPQQQAAAAVTPQPQQPTVTPSPQQRPTVTPRPTDTPIAVLQPQSTVQRVVELPTPIPVQRLALVAVDVAKMQLLHQNGFEDVRPGSYNPGQSMGVWSVGCRNAPGAVEVFPPDARTSQEGKQSADLNSGEEGPGCIAWSVSVPTDTTCAVWFLYSGNSYADHHTIKTMRVWVNSQLANEYGFNTTGYSVNNMGWVSYGFGFMSDSSGRVLLELESTTFGTKHGPSPDDIRVLCEQDFATTTTSVVAPVPTQASTLPIAPTPKSSTGQKGMSFDSGSGPIVDKEFMPGDLDAVSFRVSVPVCGGSFVFSSTQRGEPFIIYGEIRRGEDRWQKVENVCIKDGQVRDMQAFFWAPAGSESGRRVNITLLLKNKEGEVVSSLLVAQNVRVAESLPITKVYFTAQSEQEVLGSVEIQNRSSVYAQTVKNLKVGDCSFPTTGNPIFSNSGGSIDPGSHLGVDIKIRVPEGTDLSGAIACGFSFERELKKVNQREPETLLDHLLN